MDRLVVEVRGGVVVGVYSSMAAQVTILDWDHIEDGDKSHGVVTEATLSLSDMPSDTYRLAKSAHLA